MNLGEKLLKLRKEKGLSQEALAEQIKTTRQAFRYWVREWPAFVSLSCLKEIQTKEKPALKAFEANAFSKSFNS